jgi:hypothetical protein
MNIQIFPCSNKKKKRSLCLFDWSENKWDSSWKKYSLSLWKKIRIKFNENLLEIKMNEMIFIGNICLFFLTNNQSEFGFDWKEIFVEHLIEMNLSMEVVQHISFIKMIRSISSEYLTKQHSSFFVFLQGRNEIRNRRQNHFIDHLE